jgi:hypothetical protein
LNKSTVSIVWNNADVHAYEHEHKLEQEHEHVNKHVHEYEHGHEHEQEHDMNMYKKSEHTVKSSCTVGGKRFSPCR